MKIVAYVKEQMTPELSELSRRVQSEHELHVMRVSAFREPLECDAYIADDRAIVEAYEGAGVQAFDQSMLSPARDVDTLPLELGE